MYLAEREPLGIAYTKAELARCHHALGDAQEAESVLTGAAFARTVDLAATNVGDGTDTGALEAQSEPLANRILRNGFE
jgi:hypothetical protein